MTLLSASPPADPHDVFAQMRAGGVRSVGSLDTAKIATAAAVAPDEFAQAVRFLTRSVTPGVGATPGELQPVITFLADVEDRLGTSTPHLEYLRASAELFQALAVGSLGKEVDARATEPLLARLEDRIDQVPERFSTAGGAVAQDVVRGKVHSLVDRAEAARSFRAAREADTEKLIRHFFVDTGVMTYAADEEIDAGDALARARAVQESIRPYDDESTSSTTSVVISVEATFYRIYAPLFLFYAQQVPTIDWTILVCGHRGTAKELITDSRRYQNALNALNRSTKPKNVRHYYVPVPTFVREARTFSACARFFAIAPLLQKYSSVYLMDADLTTDTDPTDFLRRIARVPLAAPFTPGEAALSPWRRIMAGNFPANRTAHDSPFLDDLLIYLVHGLELRSSWMLDQNALVYAAERTPGALEDLTPHRRPFRAPAFKGTWERNHRAAQEVQS